MEVEIKSKDVDNLVRAVRTHADAKSIRRELFRGLNHAGKPVRSKMIDAIPQALPERGGLAAQMQSKIRGRITARSGKYAGVSLRFSASGGYDIRTLVGGRLRHPVFGHGPWVEQTEGVDPDAFTRVFGQEQPQLRREIDKVLATIARKVTNI